MEELLMSEVVVDAERFRREFKEVESLAESIKQVGLIQPIVLDENNHLIAGERRFRAHKLIGAEKIKVVRMLDLSSRQKAVIELEENIKRMPLTWQEECMATARLHQLYVEERGAPPKGKVGILQKTLGWRVQDTADLLGKSVGKVSQDIDVGERLLSEHAPSSIDLPDAEEVRSPLTIALDKIKSESGKKLSEFPTKDAAIKVLKGQQDIAQRMVLMDAISVIAKVTGESPEVKEVYNHGLKLGDCLEGLKTLKDGEVDCVITDPPWGIEFDDHDLRQGAHGDVDVDAYGDVEFLIPIVKECYRVMANDSHLYMFFAFKHYQRLWDMMTEIGFKVDRVPLVWWKRNAFNQHPFIRYTHDYEAALFAWKGARRLTNVQGSVFDVAPVSPALKIHPTEKSLDILKPLIINSTIEGELVVDPFGGSASTLRAAKALKRRYLGWELSEKHYLKAKDLLGE